MTAEVISLQAYKERRDRPDFDDDRKKHLKQRIADMDVEIALLNSERERLKSVLLGSNVVRRLVVAPDTGGDQ